MIFNYFITFVYVPQKYVLGNIFFTEGEQVSNLWIYIISGVRVFTFFLNQEVKAGVSFTVDVLVKGVSR